MSAQSVCSTGPGLTVALALTMVTACAAAQTTEPELNARLIKKPLFLRDAWVQDNLEFESNGNPLAKYDHTTFTLSGIDVTQVQLKQDKLMIVGDRIGVEFCGSLKRVSLRERVEIEIDGPPGTDFGAALDKIFADSLADLTPALPVYWQTYARRNFMGAAPVPSAANGPPKKLGGHITPPAVISQASPSYTPAARRLKYSGIVILSFHLLQDGSPSNVEIKTPLGLGLDEQAVAALSRYRFKPARQDGKPVEAVLILPVNFGIF